MGEIAPASPTLWIKARLNLEWGCRGAAALRRPPPFGYRAARPAQFQAARRGSSAGKRSRRSGTSAYGFDLRGQAGWLQRIDRDIAPVDAKVAERLATLAGYRCTQPEAARAVDIDALTRDDANVLLALSECLQAFRVGVYARLVGP
jgi:hypothetical protein